MSHVADLMWSGLRNLGLALVSVLLVIVLFELVLRQIRPRYQYAAASVQRSDSSRIWARTPNTAYTRMHPVTGDPHLVIHNNLGMRQHRDISPTPRPGEIRIGFFGDSFIENLRVPGGYQFTEVLDYLLNLHGRDFTVLSYGVAGYGTDQSYLYFRDTETSADLDHVFYMFSRNDLVDLHKNDLFRFGATGQLEQQAARKSPWWQRGLARLHLTYFAMDVRHWLMNDTLEAAEVSADQDRRKRRRAERSESTWVREVDRLTAYTRTGDWSQLTEYITLMRAIVEKWRSEVQAQESQFHVVIHPHSWSTDYRPLLEGYDPVDLASEFKRYEIGRAWRFSNDGHWNEFGNQLAAIHLLRYLESVLGMAPLADETIAEQLYVYYHSFADYGWKPTRWVKEVALDAETTRRIRVRYSSLERPEHLASLKFREPRNQEGRRIH